MIDWLVEITSTISIICFFKAVSFYCWKKTHSLERCIDLRQKSTSESNAIAKLQIPLSVDKISPAPDVSSYICFFWKTSLCKPCEMQDSIFGPVRTNMLYPLLLRNKYPPLLFASSGNNIPQYFFLIWSWIVKDLIQLCKFSWYLWRVICITYLIRILGL